MVDGDPGSEREAAVDVGDGLQLHVSIEGRGPPLVLLHGFTGSVHSWDLVRPLLAGHHTTLAIDLPGHGRSGAPSTPASHALPRVADAIARVLDALRIEEAALHGYSLGGRAALHAALQHPSRITRLILESSSPGIADPAEREGRRSSDAALADRIERGGIGAFVEEWEALPLWASQRRLPREVRDGLRARRLANRPAGLAASLRGAGP
ncbi:MAG: alpha/beta hydrolase fold protein, partial [Gemmatimonadetes bacterium]|nr:alpha/beta hydrolase fold protein [Gemmatimonadota bacterium]